jgi:uncharacterized coiled-coil DUF342 family protein
MTSQPNERQKLLFEIDFYKSQIANYEEIITQCKKDMDEVKEELNTLEDHQEHHIQ